MPTRSRRHGKRRRTESPAPEPDAHSPERLAGLVRHMAFGLALFATALGPLAPTIESTLSLRLIVNLFLLIAAALWIMGEAIEGRLRLLRLGIGPWFALFALGIVSGVLNASYKHPAFLTAFLWLTDMVGFYCILHLARSRRTRLLLLSVLCASAFVTALHGIHQHEIDLPDTIKRLSYDKETTLRIVNLPEEMAYDLLGRVESRRVFSTFILPNSFAGFLALVFPAFLGLYLDRLFSRPREERRFTLLVGAILLLPTLLAFYFSKSKGSALALAVALGVFLAWALKRFILRHRNRMIVAGCIFLVAMIAAQITGLLPPLRDYWGSFAVRTGYWRAGVMMVQKAPVTGIGLDNFADRYAQLKRASDQEARRAHNDYVQIAAEMGLIGFFFYVLGWIFFWRRIGRKHEEPILPEAEKAGSFPLRFSGVLILGTAVFLLEGLGGGTLRSGATLHGMIWLVMLWVAWIGVMTLLTLSPGAQGPTRGSYATVGAACGLIAFMVHSLVDFDHYVAGIFQCTWTLMALVLSTCLSEEREAWLVNRRLNAVSRLALIAVCLVMALLMSHHFVLPVADAQACKERALDFERKMPLTDRQELFERAIALYPWDVQNHAMLADLLLGRFVNTRALGPSGESAASQAIAQLKEAIQLNPQRAELYMRLGRLYEIRFLYRRPSLPEDYAKALEAYEEAERRYPSNPDMALNVARLYDIAGRQELAKGKYRGALKLSADQYHIPRQFKPEEREELEARIRALDEHHAEGTLAPPPKFTLPRLRGLPYQFRPRANIGG